MIYLQYVSLNFSLRMPLLVHQRIHGQCLDGLHFLLRSGLVLIAERIKSIKTKENSGFEIKLICRKEKVDLREKDENT